MLESVYEECLAMLLARRGFKVERQKAVTVHFMGEQLNNAYCMDLLVEGCVVVELKAVSKLDPVHSAQLNTYLRFSGCKVGLLINFNVTRLVDGLRRVARDHDDDSRISPSSAPSARNVVPESAGRSQP
jgi:GxxExxY protein